jgi:hypothetical protein
MLWDPTGEGFDFGGGFSPKLIKGVAVAAARETRRSSRTLSCLAQAGRHGVDARRARKIQSRCTETDYTPLFRSPITEKIEWHFVKRTTVALFAAISLDLWSDALSGEIDNDISGTETGM